MLPELERLEQKDWALARAARAPCGELGLLGTDVAGGARRPRPRQSRVGHRRRGGRRDRRRSRRRSARRPAWRSRRSLCFGTEEQKQKYLPRLVTGEMVGAYALSESGSGSDALGAKASATRQPDGSFALSGEKMWITNGGFADLFIVFAKVDGEQPSPPSSSSAAFPGVSTGKEEHKMGLHGSSTTPLILQDARVPADNVLGEIGKGHKVAFNVLNYGRFKLAAMCSGGARAVDRRSGALRRAAQAVRPADRLVRRDQAQARRDGDPRVTRSKACCIAPRG